MGGLYKKKLTTPEKREKLTVPFEIAFVKQKQNTPILFWLGKFVMQFLSLAIKSQPSIIEHRYSIESGHDIELYCSVDAADWLSTPPTIPTRSK